MATPTEFKKLTDPAIPTQSGTVATNDLVHTVDVSDTSGGAAGTSKRTTIQKVIDVVQANLDVENGDFTSTATSTTGFNELIVNEGVFTRILNIITYGFKIDFTLSATGSGADQLGEFTINFPEKINNFTDTNHSFQLTISESNPNTFNKSIVYNNALTATININSIGTGGSPVIGVLYVTAIYQV